MKNIEMIDSTCECILWKEEERIGHLILNDPPANKMTIRFFETLSRIIDSKIDLNKVDAIVIYGKGRHFSQGADLEDLTHDLLTNIDLNERGEITKYHDALFRNTRAFSFFSGLPIPVIASVKGVCLGSALELAISCHIRLAGESALMGLPESSFNLLPGCGGTQVLPGIIGLPKAMEMIFTGCNLTAQEAFKISLVDAVFPKKVVTSKAIQLAKVIIENYKQKYNKQNIKEYISWIGVKYE